MKEKRFICKECKMTYELERDAKECEDYCKKNHACNIDIIKRARE